MCNQFRPLVESIDLVLEENRHLAAGHVRFILLHRFRKPGMTCAPGEEIAALYLAYRSRMFFVRLTTPLLMLVNYLATSRFPQSASQIAAGMTAPFYREHGMNACNDGRLRRKISRRAIKEYVKRIRQALIWCFTEARLTVEPTSILVSEETATNECMYRFRASFEWIHLDSPARSCQLIGLPRELQALPSPRFRMWKPDVSTPSTKSTTVDFRRS